MKKDYMKRSLIDRVRANLIKAKGLKKREEWSASILRSAFAVEIYITGLLEAKLGEKLKKSFVSKILKRLKMHEKMSWVFKSVYGFSISEKYQEAARRVNDLIELRNEIAHRGSFSNEEKAKNSYLAATNLIKKVSKRLGVDINKLNL